MVVHRTQPLRLIVFIVFISWQLIHQSKALRSEDDRRAQSQAIACLAIQQRFLQPDPLRNAYPDVTISTYESRFFNSSEPFSRVIVREKKGFGHGENLIEVLPEMGSRSSVEQAVGAINDSYAFMLSAASNNPDRWLISRLKLDLQNSDDFDLADIGYLGSLRRATPDVNAHEIVGTYYLKLKLSLKDLVESEHLEIVRFSDDGSAKQFGCLLPLKPFRRGGKLITVSDKVTAILRLDESTCLPTQLLVSFAHETGQYEAVTDIDYRIVGDKIAGKHEVHTLTIQRPNSSDKVYKMVREIGYEYDVIPREEFTLSHYGLPEPGRGAWVSNWLLWASGVLAVSAAAIIFLRDKRNRT